jgi:hypothetical protein
MSPARIPTTSRAGDQRALLELAVVPCLIEVAERPSGEVVSGGNPDAAFLLQLVLS